MVIYQHKETALMEAVSLYLRNYLFMRALTPRYSNASEKTMIAIPPIILKKLTIPAVITDEVGKFAKAKPAKIHAK